MLTEVYGIKGELGNLVLEPKLTACQFDRAGKAKINGQDFPLEARFGRMVLPRALLDGFPEQVCISLKLSGDDRSKDI